MKDKSTAPKVKKPIFKKWWFWAIIVVILIAIIGSQGVKEGIEDGVNDTLNSTQSETQSDSELDNINFYPKKPKNDSTGNWRVSTIAENIDIQEYALDYYKKYFEDDNQIHAIVNFNYNTTAKISVVGNLLDVTIHEYVAKEEHDANLLFSGAVLKEYHVNMETGEVEEIQ